MLFVCLNVLLTLLQAASTPQIVLHGFVRDGATGEVLIGAHVLEQASGTGTVTNTHGFFSLSVPADTAQVVVSYLGYERRTYGFTQSPDTLLSFELAPRRGAGTGRDVPFRPWRAVARRRSANGAAG